MPSFAIIVKSTYWFLMYVLKFLSAFQPNTASTRENRIGRPLVGSFFFFYPHKDSLFVVRTVARAISLFSKYR